MIQVEVTGLENSMAMLQTLEKIAKVKRSADLNAKQRIEEGDNNAEILEYLADGGRDFVTPSKKSLDEMDKSALAEIEKSLATFKVTTTGGRITSKSALSQQQAKAVLSKALVAAAQDWMREITRRINESDWIGDGDRQLSEEYEKAKKKKHGFAYPIGKATGQLLANVAPGIRNIKLRNG
jgi:hypothetical protein